MERALIGASLRSRSAFEATQAQQRALSRWVIPVGGGLLSAVLIVIGTPHVAWYVRLVLAVIAFAYICGQSAAYLWSGQPDQG
jgi:hypothetical protein